MRGAPRAGPGADRADRLLARAVFWLLGALIVATFAGLPENPDAEVEFQTTRGLALGRGMALGGTPEAEAILAVGTEGFGVRRGRGGESYAWFGPAQALVGVPFYWLGRAAAGLFPDVETRHSARTDAGVERSEYFAHLAVGLRNPLLTAVLGALLFLAARRTGAGPRSALVAALGYGCATFAWPQARSTLNDVQTTFFAFLAFHVLLTVRATLFRGGEVRARAYAAFGAALAGVFLTRLSAAPVAAVLGSAFLVAHRGRRASLPRAAGLAGLPVLASVLGLLALNAWRWGDPLETGYGSVVDRAFFAYPPLLGLAGLWVSPGKGILWLAPAVVLVPLGVARAWRAGERFWGGVLVGVAVAVLAVVAPMVNWHGAWTYGPRHVLPLLPFLWIGVALALDGLAGRRGGAILAGALLAVGLVTNVPATLFDPMTHQDLSLQAGRFAWPAPPGATEAERDQVRFDRIQWDWRFAAPWAHWRLFAHAVRSGGDAYPLSIFRLDDDRRIVPRLEALQGFRHLGWVDYLGLGGPAWLPVFVILGALVAGGRDAVLGLRAASQAG